MVGALVNFGCRKELSRLAFEPGQSSTGSHQVHGKHANRHAHTHTHTHTHWACKHTHWACKHTHWACKHTHTEHANTHTHTCITCILTCICMHTMNDVSYTCQASPTFQRCLQRSPPLVLAWDGIIGNPSSIRRPVNHCLLLVIERGLFTQSAA